MIVPDLLRSPPLLSSSLFPSFVCWSFKCWFTQEKGKSPLLILSAICTSYTVSQSLRSPALLMFPSSSICPVMKHSSVATHDRREWELGLTCREVQASAKTRARDFLLQYKLWERLSAMIFVFRPRFSLNGLTVCLHITVLIASSNDSEEEVPWMLLSGLPCNASYVTEV